MSRAVTALIADDEPLLRDTLREQLSLVWPELKVVAEARNGREAITLFVEHRPDVCFLDIHMPGMTGVEAAQQIGTQAHLVFVTAFNHYALAAFERGALDYLVKPVELPRLEATVQRLKARIQSASPALSTEALLNELATRLRQLPAATGEAAAQPLRWIRASVGQSLRLILVDDIDYLRSDEKYTLVAWRGDAGKPAKALIRMPLKELLAQLDPQQFVQVHRSVVVNLHAISHVTRGENETASIHLKGRTEALPVSRSFLHLFRQM